MGVWNVGVTTATKLHRAVELKAEFLNLKKKKVLYYLVLRRKNASFVTKKAPRNYLEDYKASRPALNSLYKDGPDSAMFNSSQRPRIRNFCEYPV